MSISCRLLSLLGFFSSFFAFSHTSMTVVYIVWIVALNIAQTVIFGQIHNEYRIDMIGMRFGFVTGYVNKRMLFLVFGTEWSFEMFREQQWQETQRENWLAATRLGFGTETVNLNPWIEAFPWHVFFFFTLTLFNGIFMCNFYGQWILEDKTNKKKHSILRGGCPSW